MDILRSTILQVLRPGTTKEERTKGNAWLIEVQESNEAWGLFSALLDVTKEGKGEGDMECAFFSLQILMQKIRKEFNNLPQNLERFDDFLLTLMMSDRSPSLVCERASLCYVSFAVSRFIKNEDLKLIRDCEQLFSGDARTRTIAMSILEAVPHEFARRGHTSSHQVCENFIDKSFYGISNLFLMAFEQPETANSEILMKTLKAFIDLLGYRLCANDRADANDRDNIRERLGRQFLALSSNIDVSTHMKISLLRTFAVRELDYLPFGSQLSLVTNPFHQNLIESVLQFIHKISTHIRNSYPVKNSTLTERFNFIKNPPKEEEKIFYATGKILCAIVRIFPAMLHENSIIENSVHALFESSLPCCYESVFALFTSLRELSQEGEFDENVIRPIVSEYGPNLLHQIILVSERSHVAWRDCEPEEIQLFREQCEQLLSDMYWLCFAVSEMAASNFYEECISQVSKISSQSLLPSNHQELMLGFLETGLYYLSIIVECQSPETSLSSLSTLAVNLSKIPKLNKFLMYQICELGERSSMYSNISPDTAANMLLTLSTCLSCDYSHAAKALESFVTETAAIIANTDTGKQFLMHFLQSVGANIREVHQFSRRDWKLVAGDASLLVALLHLIKNFSYTEYAASLRSVLSLFQETLISSPGNLPGYLCRVSFLLVRTLHTVRSVSTPMTVRKDLYPSKISVYRGKELSEIFMPFFDGIKNAFYHQILPVLQAPASDADTIIIFSETPKFDAARAGDTPAFAKSCVLSLLCEFMYCSQERGVSSLPLYFNLMQHLLETETTNNLVSPLLWKVLSVSYQFLMETDPATNIPSLPSSYCEILLQNQFAEIMRTQLAVYEKKWDTEMVCSQHFFSLLSFPSLILFLGLRTIAQQFLMSACGGNLMQKIFDASLLYVKWKLETLESKVDDSPLDVLMARNWMQILVSICSLCSPSRCSQCSPSQACPSCLQVPSHSAVLLERTLRTCALLFPYFPRAVSFKTHQFLTLICDRYLSEFLMAWRVEWTHQKASHQVNLIGYQIFDDLEFLITSLPSIPKNHRKAFFMDISNIAQGLQTRDCLLNYQFILHSSQPIHL